MSIPPCSYRGWGGREREVEDSPLIMIPLVGISQTTSQRKSETKAIYGRQLRTIYPQRIKYAHSIALRIELT
jgi:hypothetical protein